MLCCLLPSLQSGFAQLAGNHPMLLGMVGNAGLPAAVLAPSNTALEALLREQQRTAATLSNDPASTTRSSSWQEFVQAAQKAPAESILLLLRHSKCLEGCCCHLLTVSFKLMEVVAVCKAGQIFAEDVALRL